MNIWLKLADRLGLDATFIDHLQREADATAEPQRITDWFHDFFQQPLWHQKTCQHLRSWLLPPQQNKGLITLLGNSPFLAHLIKKWPDFLDENPGFDGYAIPTPTELTQEILTNESWDDAASFLRKSKQKAYFFIGFRDLTGMASLEQTVHALSDLAQSSLEAGYRWLDRLLSQRHGVPMIDIGHGPQRSRFVILGMGKLGARELNFSSDIDLIYLYEDDRGQTIGPKQIPIKSYYNRLGQDLIRLLSQTTGDGMVFRLDLRLRPEGESGDLTLSRRSAEIYYESWGQTWERSAMIKARAVAGDLELGEEFLNNIQPFIFRKYLDFTALDAIRQMKAKIDHKISQVADYTRNVKLGYGGIREIEFFTQSQQLIHGGKHPELRHSETITTLNRFTERGLISAETSKILTEAYVFLRTVEHRLQIEWERQTHSLPDEAIAYEKVAKRMGMESGEVLKAMFSRITHQVHTIYENLFFEGKPLQETLEGEMARQLLQLDFHSQDAEKFLHQCGLTHPEMAMDSIRVIRNGPRGVALTEHDRLWYNRVAQVLLQGILNAPDPSMALHHMGDFLKALGHRVSYLAMLYENTALLNLLLRLFGTSALLSHFLIRNPYLMDHMIAAEFLVDTGGKNALGLMLAQRLQQAQDAEDHFDTIHLFKNMEMLRIGIRDLSGLAENDEIMHAISILAEVILAQILHDAMSELVARHGEPQYTVAGVMQRASFAIIAMGKLGGRELNYSSDLDLIFIHDSTGENQWTNGTNPLSNAMFFARLGQKIISRITTLTRNGVLYELDMRLRPSGQSGPLVTSLESLIHYHQHESWLWEHQALIRARFVAGNAELGARIQEVIRAVVLRPRDPSSVYKEVAEMRERIFHEKGPAANILDIKQSRGGIIDIEFLVQAIILAHGAALPTILQSHCARALYVFGKAGLLPENTWKVLQDAYDFFRLVENRLRLLHDRSENRISSSPAEQDRLAKLCHLTHGAALMDQLRHTMDQVSQIVHEIIHVPQND
ncbi:MAG: bifunctional [glutamate--ammonia ligase]-adenylyl-L-tyrosine phosphorylase/[glutamate--ammonia-ligase] adenylyltransferase [Nitrospirae bacterium]|nr:bifunctional [glutamate--ammonia ligase]-adenylyl-L-tyrosine phosphorylase/[glutamate--ammonia-ligase] adenylyltransferase [Magnetococcales bacterium]HAT51528.1 bifunctional [glutamate--ammonia ligase]-adenylyl-L-tyrosine phosphorylase/[glutamate--ammonia-ligase] adenylyltransferase [Alphaproteobacteria bacterium]